jgi:hypothetical protein
MGGKIDSMTRLTISRLVFCGMFFAAFSLAFSAKAAEISNVIISDVADVSASVSWTTDTETDATIHYGLDDAFGIVRNPEMNTKHLLTIQNLEPSTTYHFRVVSADKDGNTSATAGFIFTTKGKLKDKIIKDIKKIIDPEELKEIKDVIKEVAEEIEKPPVVVGAAKVVPTENGATVTWVTDRESSSEVELSPEGEYNPDADDPYSIKQGDSEESVTRHVVEVVGLEPATIYHFRVRSTDSLGLTGVSPDDTFETKSQLPTVQNARVTKVQEESATITWSTPVLAKGVVQFTNMRTRATKTLGNPVFAANQSIVLTGLEFGTRYNVVIVATNKAGDNYESRPLSFITVRDVIPPVISKVRNESTLYPGEDTKVQTIVSWLTDEPAACQVFYTQGLVKAEGGGDSLLPEANPLTDHTQVVVGFAPGTVYKYWLTCKDESGNESQSEDYVLITPIREKNIIDIILENFQGTFGWVNKIGK